MSRLAYEALPGLEVKPREVTNRVNQFSRNSPGTAGNKIETRNYHMIGMDFTIKHCIRVP